MDQNKGFLPVLYSKVFDATSYCNSFIKFLGNLRIEFSIMFVCGGILSKRLLGILPDNLIFLLLILILLIEDHSPEDCPMVDIVNFRFGIFSSEPSNDL